MTTASDQIRFRRPLLKLSGEMLGGSDGFGFNRSVLDGFAKEIKTLTESGIVPGIVLGGGNFFRGARTTLPALKRHRADAIGMLATVMNAICFAEHLEAAGVKAKVYSAVPMHPLVAAYDIDDAIANLKAGVVCLYSGGTGNPYFSTDSAAALRAIETGCDVLIKGTKVDGVYDSDPVKNPSATKFLQITYEEVLRRNLGVMDLVAITLCRDNRMPLKVLSLADSGNLLKACSGATTGTDVIES
ncbi:MAG: Uridylate kinase [Candidatus Rifleibacterium amylolyticum]|nr:MAG: Uridylate kinase [Candidatus Rifleibacterium amylolyticum]NLF97966.1 UMP kinase [Candidatus Riflebacteria bacterium]